MRENKNLLLRYLSMAIPYNVKILHNDWDYDRDCDFSSVETLIGIDDRFIYTLKEGKKDEHSIIEPLSVLDYKPYLRPMSSMTEEEEAFVYNGHIQFWRREDYCNQHHLDYRGLIGKGLAIEAPKGMYYE